MNLSQGMEGALSMPTKAPAGWTTRPFFLCKCELREHLLTFHHFVTARESENSIPENNLPKTISSPTSHDETRLSMSRILKSPRSFFSLAFSGDLPTLSTGLIDLVLPACSDAGSTSQNPDHGHGPMITQASTPLQNHKANNATRNQQILRRLGSTVVLHLIILQRSKFSLSGCCAFNGSRKTTC